MLCLSMCCCSRDKHREPVNNNELVNISDVPNYDSTGAIDIIPGISIYGQANILGSQAYLLNNNEIDDYRKLLKEASDPLKIRTINFRKCGLDKLPEAVAELKNLVSIDLSENPQLDFADAFTKLSKLKHLRELQISDNDFIILPEEISLLKEIESIDLSRNIDLKLDDLFKLLQQLKKLNSLDLSNNIFVEIPAGLGALGNLTKIDLSYNWLQSVPLPVFRLAGLKELSLKGNAIKHIPDGISGLKLLKSLDISYNELFNITDSLYSLPGLECIILDGNPNLDYSYICSMLAAKCSLKSLGLAKNWLKSVPNAVTDMLTLEELNLSNNYLSSLPQGIYNLRRLKLLDISGNKIKYVSRDALKKNFAKTLIRNIKGDSDTLMDLVF